MSHKNQRGDTRGYTQWKETLILHCRAFTTAAIPNEKLCHQPHGARVNWVQTTGSYAGSVISERHIGILVEMLWSLFLKILTNESCENLKVCFMSTLLSPVQCLSDTQRCIKRILGDHTDVKKTTGDAEELKNSKVLHAWQQPSRICTAFFPSFPSPFQISGNN